MIGIIIEYSGKYKFDLQGYFHLMHIKSSCADSVSEGRFLI